MHNNCIEVRKLVNRKFLKVANNEISVLRLSGSLIAFVHTERNN